MKSSHLDEMLRLRSRVSACLQWPGASGEAVV